MYLTALPSADDLHAPLNWGNSLWDAYLLFFFHSSLIYHIYSSKTAHFCSPLATLMIVEVQTAKRVEVVSRRYTCHSPALGPWILDLSCEYYVRIAKHFSLHQHESHLVQQQEHSWGGYRKNAPVVHNTTKHSATFSNNVAHPPGLKCIGLSCSPILFHFLHNMCSGKFATVKVAAVSDGFC
jgi:hypothetical protein